MDQSLSFWPIECQDGEPDLFVCFSCLEEVFQAKIPVEGCSGCGAIGSFEPFHLAAIKDWGSADLIRKSEHASSSTKSVRNASSDHTVG